MAVLVVEEGANRGAVFPLAPPETILGRDLGCQVPIYDHAASRRHCAVSSAADRHEVRDLGSRNGTLLNGLPVDEAGAPLGAGDRIRIGETLLRFEPGLELPGPEPTTLTGLPGDARRGRASGGPPLPATIPPDLRERLARGRIVAESEAMRAAVRTLARAARSDATVLITGESGTGKELCARLVHAGSPRARGPFVAVNCAAIPEGLVESELFGHERGAFTGAEARRLGLFEMAAAGTLFLDEVSECAPSVQAKLLRALEAGEIRRVGGGEPIAVDVRVVAASNRDLRARVAEGSFREDLLYRLSVVTAALPPLRARPEDLEPLCRALLAGLAREHGRAPARLGAGVLDALRGHSFPGNVRELKNVLERALILGDGRVVETSDLPGEVRAGRARPATPDSGALSLRAMEKRHIARVLEEMAWNKSHAAKALGIDRKTLYARIAEFDLRKPT